MSLFKFDFNKILSPRFYNSEESSPSGESTDQDNTSQQSNDLSADSMGIDSSSYEEILKNDPNFAKFATSNKPSGEEDQEENSPGTEDTNGSEDLTEGLPSNSEDDVHTGESQETAIEFSDDVIPGLKGKDLGMLSKEAQEAIGTYYQKSNESTEKLSEIEARLNKLLEDPIVKMRAENMDSSNPSKFDVRGFTDAEKNHIKMSAIKSIGLDNDEAEKLFESLSGGLEAVAKQMANDLALNIVSEKDTESKIKETTKKGHELLLGLSKFNKNLSLEEKDLTNIFKLREKHPEWKKFNDGIGKIMKWAGEMGIDYSKALKLGDEKFYKVAAAALDMPSSPHPEVAKKLTEKAISNALKPFLKGSSPKTLEPGSKDGASQKAGIIHQSTIKGGYDIVRLAKDPSYLNKCIEQKVGDMDHLEKITRYAEEGRALIEKQPKK